MTNKEKIIISEVNDCIAIMGTLSPSNPAALKEIIQNRKKLCLASKKINSILSSFFYDEPEPMSYYTELLNEIKTILA